MSQELDRANRGGYEARLLGCTKEQFTKAAYPEPEPTEAWAKPMTVEELELQKRLKRWNGDDEWDAPSARGSDAPGRTARAGPVSTHLQGGPALVGSQEARVLEILGDGRWHSGNEFLRAFMPRYSSVIHTLRHKRGYGIEGRKIAGSSVFEFRISSYPAKYVKGEQTSWL